MTQTGTGAPLAPLIQAVGATLLSVLAGDVAGARRVGGIAIHDPHDTAARPERAVVLGVGVAGERQIADVVWTCLSAGACALVLRDDTGLPEAVAAEAATGGLVLLRIAPGISWSQLSVALSTALDRETARGRRWGEPERVNKERSLSDLANALAATMHAPVTIEDLSSQVLGYSDNQNLGDAQRHETILGRVVPPKYTEKLRRAGIFERLYAHDEPVLVDLAVMPELDVPRVAIRIANGQYVIGSIWVATATPIAEIDTSVLRAAAERAGELIDSGTHDQDRRRRYVGALVGEDELEAARSAQELEIDTEFIYLVVAEPVRSGLDLSARGLDRHADILHLQLTGVSSRAIAAAVGGRVVGVLPVEAPETGGRRAVAAAERFAQTVPAHVVVGSAVKGAGGVFGAWSDALKALASVNRSPATANRATVVRVEDAYFDVLLHEVGEKLLARDPALPTPVSRLLDYDAEHHTDFAESLVVYLREFGSVHDAAQALHIHANTMRYRLRRLSDICGIDLTNHDARFKAMLELRIRNLLA
ncbi:helix-turn-helix domain-containing protein [Actinosynnema sp. NPDC047251]|uniref:Transcriptional regulator, PucR family n=1 Tax=Saccharothrix espanaensis (strain ATCC 51144 / DSM 44229 / JCM 9112 / NBRC 15066 / NRRL 15764) TaxID=1179773 RepID=K0K0P6_SACES|nr:helix-turn-helix domain-containing protein [Saccharothrix espanaensis]CCH30103.1 Transcriptional regulator, PucR family [Saccharothrix espanaensis DSM 44229]